MCRVYKTVEHRYTIAIMCVPYSTNSFVFVTFVSRLFATKHSLILIMSKSCTDYK